MRATFLDLLACPSCGSSLLLESSETEEEHVMEGALTCAGCHRSYRILGGIPRLIIDEGRCSKDSQPTADRFGYEWNEFADFDFDEELESFSTWMQPKRLAEFAGLTLLDGGCGMGRHAVIAARQGAMRIVGIDLGTAVSAAFQNTRHLPNVCIVQGDLRFPPVQDKVFDAAYSVGVLHHLPDPRTGFRALVDKVRSGGWIHAWVYGYEGSELVVHVVNPLRRITSKMPLGLLKVLCVIPTSMVVAASRTLYAIPGLGTRLPFSGYMRWLKAYRFRKVHAIVFDQLLTPIAHYMRREEVEAMVDDVRCVQVVVEHNRGMSWSATVRVAS